jgi:PAS domain-containing protein
MIGKSFLNFIYSQDINKTIEIVQRCTPGCTTSNFENRFLKKNENIVHVMWSARWDENEGLLFCVARDGSSENEIKIRLEKAQSMARLINMDYDAVNNCFSYVSDMFYNICGLSKNENPVVTPNLFWNLIHPEDKEWLLNNFFIKNPKLTYHEYRIIRPEGAIVFI